MTRENRLVLKLRKDLLDMLGTLDKAEEALQAFYSNASDAMKRRTKVTELEGIRYDLVLRRANTKALRKIERQMADTAQLEECDGRAHSLAAATYVSAMRELASNQKRLSKRLNKDHRLPG